MRDATDTIDILTLTHESKLTNLLTSVGRLLTVSVKCQQSVMRGVSKMSVYEAKLSEREVSVKRRKNSIFRLYGHYYADR